MSRYHRQKIQIETLAHLRANPEIGLETRIFQYTHTPHTPHSPSSPPTLIPASPSFLSSTSPPHIPTSPPTSPPLPISTRPSPHSPPQSDRPMRIYIAQMDTLEAVLYGQMVFGAKFCALIMGNDRTPGGGYLNGAGAQEESICRRSNLPECFERIMYPIPTFGTVFVENLKIIRESEDNGYEFHVIPITCHGLLACAYDQPNLNDLGEFYPDELEGTRTKIRAMLDTCVQQHQRHLILGAFGCGAFENPPHQVAEIFREVLSSSNYHKSFEVVIFAILDGSTTCNYEIFKDILSPILD